MTKTLKKPKISKQLTKKLSELPSTPGVYIFVNDHDEIIYVGKAKSLRSRVRSYFRNDKTATPKTEILKKQIADLDFIALETELEAFLLENTLIKKHQPKYNIRMRDDKNYMYLKITNEIYPQVMRVRKMKKDGAKYFGPFTAGMALKEVLRILGKIFPYRKCNQIYFKEHEKLSKSERESYIESLENKKQKVTPCLFHQMGQCVACDSNVTAQDHQKYIDEVSTFFEGKIDIIADGIEAKMSKAAVDMDFEFAAKYRDQLQMISALQEKQHSVMTDQKNRDFFGVAARGTKACVMLFKVRNGIMTSKEEFHLQSGLDLDPKEVLIHTLLDYYSVSTDIPSELIVPFEFEDQSVIKGIIKEARTTLLKRDSKLEVIVPKFGEKKNVLDIAMKNTEGRLEELFGEWMTKDMRIRKSLEQIKEALELDSIPRRIECYDISHHQGTEAVGSMVVFENGVPSKNEYRKFQIKVAKGGDDYGSMKEVFLRRFSRMSVWDTRSEIGIRKASQSDLKFFQTDLEISLSSSDLVYVAKKKKDLVGYIIVKPGGENVYKASYVHILWVDEKYAFEKIEFMLLSYLLKKNRAISVLYISLPQNLVEYMMGFGFLEVKKHPDFLKDIPKYKLSDQLIFRLDRKGLDKKERYEMPPDLVIVDGGKGQLRMATDALMELSMMQKTTSKNRWKAYPFAVVGLAKKQEEVFVPNKSDPIVLENDSLGSFLIQQLRNEAHRFANSYRKVRKKKALFE